MTEIRSLPPAAPLTAPRQPSGTPDLALKLLQPLQGLLAVGESAKAEVIEVKSGAQDFQMLLRLTLDSGKQTSVRASSPAPLGLGNALTITALNDQNLAARLLAPAQQPLTVLDLKLLPAGTLVQGRVMASQSNPDRPGFRLVVELDSPSIGQRLLIDAARPMPIGSLLAARVQNTQSLLLQPLGERLDRALLGQQLVAQHARQGSLTTLFSALQNTSGLPPEIRESIGHVLGLPPPMDALGDAECLKRALNDCGIFLETRLHSGLAAAPANDLKAELLRLIARLLPSVPGATPQSAAQSGAIAGQALPNLARQMLGSLGYHPEQQALAFPLPARWNSGQEEPTDLENLLKLATAAIARLQTHQLSGLTQTQTTQDGLQVTTWQLELPMRDGHNITPLQARIQREDPGEQRPERDKGETLWRIELAFDVPPLGPLQVQAQLLAGSLSGQLWAERRETARLIEDELGSLRERLQTAGLTVGELQCRHGMPPQGPRTRLAQRFVDERA